MPTENRDVAHLRASPRIKIFQPAEMVDGGGASARVHLLNISTGGALVYGDRVPAVGEVVRLACGFALGPGRVQWTEGRRFGVAFAQPISAQEVERLVRIQDEMIVATTARLGLPPIRQFARVLSAA
jgi:hypothetical protein